MNKNLRDLIDKKMIDIVKLHTEQKYEECISAASGIWEIFFNEAAPYNPISLNMDYKESLSTLKDICRYYIQDSKDQLIILENIQNEEECKIIS